MLYAIVAVIILILDQLTKLLIINNLDVGATAPLIPGLVQLTHIQNDGAAFGIFSGGSARWFFVILTLIVAVGVIYLLSKNIIKGKLGRWMLIMVVAGGLGNCIDRLLKGYVTDMFQLQFKILGGDFAIFNVADIFITVCGIIFCVYLIFHREPVEETPLPAKMPPRQMPTDRPVRTDYITQLKKPVVEGRRSIEAELAAKAAEAQAARNPEGVITDWNIPEDFAADKAPAEKPAPRPKPVETDFTTLFNEPSKRTAPEAKPARPEVKPETKPEEKPAYRPEAKPEAKPEPLATAPEAPVIEPTKPAKKDDEFSLDDIIAEFKD